MGIKGASLALSEKEKARVERGRQYALKGLLDPETTGGELKRFGIDKDIPIVGVFGKGGSWYEATKPDGDLANIVADFGSILLMSLGNPVNAKQGAPNLGALRRGIALGKAQFGTRLGLRGRTAFNLYWKNARGNALYIAKRVAADLPEDFVEELVIFGMPEPSYEQSKELDRIINAADPQTVEALRNLIESNDDASAQYWQQYLANVGFGTIAAGLFRGSLGALNNEWRFFKAKKGVKDFFNSKKIQAELELKIRPNIETIAETTEAAQEAIYNTANKASLEVLNKDFTQTTRDGLDVINKQIDRINELRGSISQLDAGQTTTTETLEKIATLPEKTLARYNTLPKLIKARLASLKSRKYNKKNLTLKETRTRNRYQNDLEKYQQELKDIEADLAQRVEASEGVAKVDQEYTEKLEPLRNTEEAETEAVVRDFSLLMEMLSKTNEERFKLAPDMDLNNDPYYAAFKRVQELFEEYKVSDDPTIQDRLFDTIQEEYKKLQEFGGKTPLKTPQSEVAKAEEAKKAAEVDKKEEIKVEEEEAGSVLEGQEYTAPDVPAKKEPITTAIQKIEKTGEVEVVADGVPTKVDKKTLISKLIRMSPDGDQAKTAFNRLSKAIEKLEKGMNVPLEERTVINTVGDLLNLLNLGRVAGEEAIQKALRDLDKTVLFLSEIDKKAKKAVIKAGRPSKAEMDARRAALKAEKQRLAEDTALKEAKTDAVGKDEDLGDPWDDPDVMPVVETKEGGITIDPDAKGEPIAYTTEPPETAAQKRVKIGKELELKTKEGPIKSSVEDLVTRGSSEEAGQDFLSTVNEMAKLEAQGKQMPYEWEQSKLAAISRTIGDLDTIEQRRAALVDLFAKLSGKPENYLPAAARRAVRFAGSLVEAEGEYIKFYRLLENHLKATTKSEKLLKDVQTQMMTTPLLLYVQANRVYKLVDALSRKNLTTEASGAYRSYLAEESFMLYKQTSEWMKLRSLTSGTLAAQQKKWTDRPINLYKKLLAKKVKDPDILATENAIKAIEEMRSDIASEALQDVDTYIGLPSNLKVVESTLRKFLDPKFVPEQRDLDIFTKITSQLAVSGLNPSSLGSLRISGDEIVGRNLKSYGLSNPATQTSFMPQTAIYGGGKWVNGMLQTVNNRFWDLLPWMKDEEATMAALKEQRIWNNFWKAQQNITTNVFENFYKGRQFNRSIITDAAVNLDNSGKFQTSSRTADPFREQAALEVLNKTDPLPNKGLGRLLNKYFEERYPGEGELKARQFANNWHLNWMQFHDMVFKGDTWEALGAKDPKTGKGSFFGSLQKFTYNWMNPLKRGSDAALQAASGGRATPLKSKLPGGERVGETFPLFASETSTELVGGWFAAGYSASKAWGQVLDMVDGTGRPKYVEYDADGSFNKDFLAAVQKVYDEEYTTPIVAGIGDNAEEIAKAFTDEDAQLLALGMDMMMPVEDDIYGAITGAIQKAQRNQDTGEANVVMQAFWPYIKAPLNAHKHHFYHTQPEPFSSGVVDIPMTPGQPWMPMGVPMEGAIGLARMVQAWDGKVMGKQIIGEEGRLMGLDYKKEKDLMVQRLGWFKSKVHHKDPKVRAEARSALTLATAFNFGVMSLVESGQIEATGGQVYSYQEANGAYIPPYHVKLGGYWVPYRWIPYFGELMAFSTNFRDFSKNGVPYLNQNAVGISVVSMAATIMDTPAISGIDTFVSALRSPDKAEALLIDYIERTMGSGYSPFVYAIGRLTTEAYHARPLEGASPAVLFKSEEDVNKYNEELGYGERWSVAKGNLKGSLDFISRAVTRFANKTGMLPLIEIMDQELLGQQEGDFRQAHWYKPGDITYTGPRQRSVLQTLLGRHWPVPHEGDAVDMELFRNGIKPPKQVFRRYGGIVANEAMVNKFRRFLGSEFTFSNGDSLYERYRSVISGERPIPGYPGVFYNDLEDDPKNSLTLDGNLAPWVRKDSPLTKRAVLMAIRKEAIKVAAEQFLRGEKTIYPIDSPSYQEPTNLRANDVANQIYKEWRKQNPNRTIN